MRIAIVSDTHMPRGDRSLPAACVAELRGADAIIHAGDFMDAPVLDLVRSFGPPVHAVRGNVDSAALARTLPVTCSVPVPDGLPIAVIHDSGHAIGRMARMRALFGSEHQAVVFGHSHLPLHEISDDGAFQLFNPGSPTERRRAPSHTMGVATVTDGAVSFSLIEL